MNLIIYSRNSGNQLKLNPSLTYVMTKKKWWEIDLSQGDRSIEEIKVEFEENGSINLTETEVKRFDRYNRKEQKRLMSIPLKEAGQSAITERKAIMFVVSGMFILLGFNVFGMSQSASGFFLTSFGFFLLIFALSS